MHGPFDLAYAEEDSQLVVNALEDGKPTVSESHIPHYGFKKLENMFVQCFNWLATTVNFPLLLEKCVSCKILVGNHQDDNNANIDKVKGRSCSNFSQYFPVVLHLLRNNREIIASLAYTGTILLAIFDQCLAICANLALNESYLLQFNSSI